MPKKKVHDEAEPLENETDPTAIEGDAPANELKVATPKAEPKPETPLGLPEYKLRYRGSRQGR